MLADHLDGARRGGIDRLGLWRSFGGRIPDQFVLDLGLDRRQEIAGPAVALCPLLDRTPRDPRLPGDLGDRKLARPVFALDPRPVGRVFLTVNKKRGPS